jgi:hypothetical protein
MQQLGYFGDSVGRALGAEEVLEPEGGWFFSRRFLLLDFACLHIGLSSKCCGTLKFRF